MKYEKTVISNESIVLVKIFILTFSGNMRQINRFKVNQVDQCQ